MALGFQKTVNDQLAPGIQGDFASTNPRRFYVAGPGGLVAGAFGVACGYFAWVDALTHTLVSNFGPGKPSGFMHNAHNALITVYLAQTSLVIPVGFQVADLMTGGDVWALNDGSGPAAPGMKAFANNATGQCSFGQPGSLQVGGSGDASSIAAETFEVTASIAVVPAQIGPGTNPGVMTVTVVASGIVQPGAPITGAGVAAGTVITQQLTSTEAGGALGGRGTYGVNIAQTVVSETIDGTYGLLTVGGTVTGVFGVNDPVQGTGGGGVAAGTYITRLGTGAGGAGTYVVNLTQTTTNSTINALSATETDWIADSFGAPGETVKIREKV